MAVTGRQCWPGGHLYRAKLRPREGESPAQGHTARQDSNPGLQGSFRPLATLGGTKPRIPQGKAGGHEAGVEGVLTLARWCRGTSQGSRLGSARPPACAQTSPAEGAAAGAASQTPSWLPWGRWSPAGDLRGREGKSHAWPLSLPCSVLVAFAASSTRKPSRVALTFTPVQCFLLLCARNRHHTQQ